MILLAIVGVTFSVIVLVRCWGPLVDSIKEIKDTLPTKEERENYKRLQQKIQQERIENERREIQKDREIHKPKCPTCGSERVEPISEAERALDISGFGTLMGGGLNSKTLGKSYKCKNCDYMW